MNKTIIIFVSSTALLSALISGLTTHAITKKKCENKFRKEINDIFKSIQDTDELKPNPEEKVPPEIIKPDLGEYASKYRDEKPISGRRPYGESERFENTYEIEYNDLEEDQYTMINLTLYADGVLADDQDIPLNDSSYAVGNYLDILGDRDTCFIRNERRKVDYEISRSKETFKDMMETHPEKAQVLMYNNALETYYANKEDNGS